MAVQAKVALLDLRDDAADGFIHAWAVDADRQAAGRYSLASRSRQSLAGLALVRSQLPALPGDGENAWKIDIDGRGKPRVTSTFGVAGPNVSISHSMGMVAVALTTLGNVGIDVENRLKLRSIASIAEYAFGPREAAEARASDTAFYRIWTLREALAKASGAGLREAADGQDRVAGTPPDGAWTMNCDGDWCYLFCREIGHAFSLSLAIRTPTDAPRVYWNVQSVTLYNPLPLVSRMQG